MDMASMMGMFGGGGGGGMQLPQAQLGAATMGGPQPAGAGFGMGQPLMQGQMGASQMAPGLGAFGMSTDQQNELMRQLGPMGMQMMQNAQGGQPQQMMPMMQRGMGMQQQQQGPRDYLAQGGGVAPRTIINKGY